MSECFFKINSYLHIVSILVLVFPEWTDTTRSLPRSRFFITRVIRFISLYFNFLFRAELQFGCSAIQSTYSIKANVYSYLKLFQLLLEIDSYKLLQCLLYGDKIIKVVGSLQVFASVENCVHMQFLQVDVSDSDLFYYVCFAKLAEILSIFKKEPLRYKFLLFEIVYSTKISLHKRWYPSEVETSVRNSTKILKSSVF